MSVLILAPLFCERISSFNYSGLKKTKEAYLDKTLEHFLGQDNNEETLHDIETALQAEGIFESVTVETDANNPSAVNITVKEKITFIPLPFLYTSSSTWTAGGMLMNMNTFGNKTMLVSGLFFSDSAFSGIFVLSKPAPNVKDRGWSVFTGLSHSKTQATDIYGTSFTEYKAFSASLNTSLQKKLTPFTTVSTGLGLSFISFADALSLSPEYTESKAFQTKLSAGFSHGKNDWNGWYLNSRMFSASFTGGYDFINRTDFYKVSSTITFQQPLTKRLRLCLAGAGEYCHDVIIKDLSGQASACVTILPGEFVTAETAGGNTGFEFAVKKFNWGLLSLYSNYQFCTALNTDGEYKLCQGISGGTRLYLSKIAFPAFAFGVSHNFTTKKYYWSGSLGISY